MVRHLPNLLTSMRIAAVPVLGWLAYGEQRTWFAALLAACLAGDVADGQLARALRATSRTGALLDSVADTLLLVAALGGLLVFETSAVRAHPVAFGVVPLAWLAENVAALVRYGRLSSFHTYLSRAAAVMMGAFAAALFLWGPQPVLLYLTSALVVIATAEEFLLMRLLPEWTPDVRGVYWVLRDQQGRTR